MSYEQRRDEYLTHVKACVACKKWWNKRIPFGKINSTGYFSVKPCPKARELSSVIFE